MKKTDHIYELWAVENEKGELWMRNKGVPYLLLSKEDIELICNEGERPVKVEIRKVKE